MVDWSDEQLCRPRRRAHAWVETVGAGAGKSGCFCDVLRWSVGRHGASDLDEHSFGRLEHIRQSVLRRIAVMEVGDRFLRWRALRVASDGHPHVRGW